MGFMISLRFSVILFCLSAFSSVLLAADVSNKAAEPTGEFLAKIAKIDACAMALHQVAKPTSKALEVHAEKLMAPFYTKELDAMPDEKYNQIPWVKVYNGLYIEEQNRFHQPGGPEFAKAAIQQQYQQDCMNLADDVLNTEAL
jgi:hypothetical protein